MVEGDEVLGDTAAFRLIRLEDGASAGLVDDGGDLPA